MKFNYKGQKRPRGFCRALKDIEYFEGYLRHFRSFLLRLLMHILFVCA
jgi:hypothetical protein